MEFIARRAFNHRNGHYYSLRVIYPTSRLPGDRSSEFGRIRQEKTGWNAWSDDEDFDLELKAACYRGGKFANVRVVLAECKKAYIARFHADDPHTGKTEADYEKWVASMGDPSPAGQDWDANHRV